MRSKKEDESVLDNLRILATQIETINQQLAGGASGGGGPAVLTALRSVEEKLNYLYEFIKGMQVNITDSQQEYFNQVGNKVTAALNTNLTQVFAKIQDLFRSLNVIQQNLLNSPSIQAKDIMEMKKTLASLIDVYKDEVRVFKEQNKFLQQRLVDIEKKIDKLIAPRRDG